VKRTMLEVYGVAAKEHIAEAMVKYWLSIGTMGMGLSSLRHAQPEILKGLDAELEGMGTCKGGNRRPRAHGLQLIVER